jgi:hypothetical protein
MAAPTAPPRLVNPPNLEQPSELVENGARAEEEIRQVVFEMDKMRSSFASLVKLCMVAVWATNNASGGGQKREETGG